MRSLLSVFCKMLGKAGASGNGAAFNDHATASA